MLNGGSKRHKTPCGDGAIWYQESREWPLLKIPIQLIIATSTQPQFYEEHDLDSVENQGVSLCSMAVRKNPISPRLELTAVPLQGEGRER